jgi:hypothetical protein
MIFHGLVTQMHHYHKKFPQRNAESTSAELKMKRDGGPPALPNLVKGEQRN